MLNSLLKKEVKNENDLAILNSIDRINKLFIDKHNESLNGLPLNKINEFPMEKGTGITTCILYTDELAIASSWFSAGSLSPIHRHEKEEETIIIIDGHAIIELIHKDKPTEYKELNENDVIVIPMGVDHVFSFITETRLIAKTRPADPTFPRQ